GGICVDIEFGICAHAEGNNSIAGTFSSHAGGDSSLAKKPAQYARASGFFAIVGDAQKSETYLRMATTDASSTELTIDGASPNGTDERTSNRYIVASDKIYACTITVSAAQDDGSTSAMFKRMCIVKNVSGTVSLDGTPLTIGDINSTSWS